jgi:hypothetical protein
MNIRQVSFPGVRRPVSVILPRMPVTAYKTYQISAPLSTHWRSATCDEVECSAYLNGWRTTVPANSRMEHTLRNSGRRWVSEERLADGNIAFSFAPGTECFQSSMHRVRVRDNALYVVRDGDWRGNPRRTRPRRHTSAESFVDDWASHQQELADHYRKG